MLKKDKKKFIADAYKALGKEEFDDIVDAMKNANPLVFPSISSGLSTMRSQYQTYASNFIASTNPSGHVLQLPMEDIELSDMERIRGAVESMMDSLYPPFEPEIVHAVDKDYFLPALKVLVYLDGEYFSPQQHNKWTNMELEAMCVPSPWSFGQPKVKTLPNGQTEISFEPQAAAVHDTPKEDCDCGIYGSVNLEEVASYLNEGIATQLQRTWIANYGYDKADPIIGKKLCIIEPSVNADWHLCRKGWKASHAFISEIVGETISPEEASNLLSISWKREIDIRRLHENR